MIDLRLRSESIYRKTQGLLQQAGVAQLVEYELPKLGVAGSNPVARSRLISMKRSGGAAPPLSYRAVSNISFSPPQRKRL